MRLVTYLSCQHRQIYIDIHNLIHVYCIKPAGFTYVVYDDITKYTLMYIPWLMLAASTLRGLHM